MDFENDDFKRLHDLLDSNFTYTDSQQESRNIQNISWRWKTARKLVKTFLKNERETEKRMQKKRFTEKGGYDK